MQRAVLVGLPALFFGVFAQAATPATYTVAAGPTEVSYPATGTVQAVRQGTLGAQISGRITEVMVRSGDPVKTGQALLRIEAEEAVDAASASQATATGAAARLTAARAEFERAQRLRAQEYISAAAMQRAEAALHSAEADAEASGAAASAARTRAGWRTVTAPYAGVVTDVLVAAGDLATPGRPLLGMYAPGALRVIAQVPESLAGRLALSKSALLTRPDSDSPTLSIQNWSVVSAVDPATHSVEVRAELPADASLQPGQFARLRLPLKGGASAMHIPTRAVLTRSEVTAVFVIDAHGAAHLRQVRLGPAEGGEVAVLSGLTAGEKIALDPIAAGRN